MSHLRPAFVLLVVLTALTGLAYPLAVTAIGQAAFPGAANGSLVVDGQGNVIGSELIGQAFASDRYLRPRPSATNGADPADAAKVVDAPYNAAASTGSNLGPTSAKLAARLKDAVAALPEAERAGPVPGDAVTASGSGLDPHISPATALAQTPRVAAARGIPEADVRRIIEASIEGRELGFLGEPRVNVLRANRALDAAASASRP